MKASIGGVVNLFAIAAFLVLLMSFLLFNVSYAKAFRVKNKIITTYEQYEGNCEKGSKCYQEIARFESEFGYKVTYLMEETPESTCYQELGYCSEETKVKKKINNTDVTFYKYKIRTEVYIKFPLIEEILGIGRFSVSGETHEIIK